MSAFASSMPHAHSDRRRWIALAVIVTAQFMVVLDVAIVNVALPTIKTDLGFSQESLQWVITAYAILFGGVLLLGGRMADLLGRRRMFMAGMALFTVSSLLDGLAWSEGSLISFRALQGLGAALLSPAALSILTTTFAEGRERNLALGIWGAVSGPAAPRACCSAARSRARSTGRGSSSSTCRSECSCSRVTPRLVDESHAEVTHRHFDLPGAASITGGLMLLVYAMTRAVQHGWGTPETIGLLVASAVLIVGFVGIELRSSAPLLPMRMFRLRTLTGSNVAGFLLGCAVFSQFFLLTLYMQQVLHYSALQTGVAYIALTLTIIVFANVSQALALRVGIRRAAAGRARARHGRARPVRPAAGGRPLLLGSVPGVPDQRARHGVRVRPHDDRRAGGRAPRRRRRRLGADQPDAADRRGDRRRRRHDDRRDVHEPLPRRASGSRPGGRRRAHARLLDRVLRARGHRGGRSRRVGAADRVEARARAGGSRRRRSWLWRRRPDGRRQAQGPYELSFASWTALT